VGASSATIWLALSVTKFQTFSKNESNLPKTTKGPRAPCPIPLDVGVRQHIARAWTAQIFRRARNLNPNQREKPGYEPKLFAALQRELAKQPELHQADNDSAVLRMLANATGTIVASFDD